ISHHLVLTWFSTSLPQSTLLSLRNRESHSPGDPHFGCTLTTSLRQSARSRAPVGQRRASVWLQRAMFRDAASDKSDHSLFAEALEQFYKGKPDPRTLELLRSE